MGQRHQIYVAFRDYDLKRTTSLRLSNEPAPVKVVGIHHQWLYGQTAAIQAMRMMEYVTVNAALIRNADADYSNPFYSSAMALTTLQNLYTMIPERGYFSNVHVLENGECENPLMGDNNDGITIFDFVDFSAPKYCLMGIRDDGRSFEGEDRSCVSFLPYSATRYENFYYPDTDDAKWKACRKPSLVREIMVDKRKIARLSNKFTKNVLTINRVREIFPVMFADKAVTWNCRSV